MLWHSNGTTNKTSEKLF